MQIKKKIIEQYVREKIAEEMKIERINSLKINLLDSEKKRTFLANIDGIQIFIKLNLPFWDEENTKQKMINEKIALEILKERKIKSVPELYSYNSHNKFLNTQVLVMSYIPDTRTPLNRDNIPKVVEIVQAIHSIKSKNFTVPFGDFTCKLKGDGYDFINSYIKVLEKDIDKIKNFSLLGKIGYDNLLNFFLFFIKNKIKHNKNIFKKPQEFSIIHGHLARNKERKHILIDRNNNIYITDWENVCFGERELEIASFLYENDIISASLKRQFIDLYNNRICLNFKKIYIYIYLLILDDLIEEFKKKAISIDKKSFLGINKKFLLFLYKQKKLLIKLANRI